MSDFKECKVQIGEKRGSLFKDIIFLPITPNLLGDLAQIFEERAMNAPSFWRQGLERDHKNYFQDALNYWRQMREEYDRLNPVKEEGDD